VRLVQAFEQYLREEFSTCERTTGPGGALYRADLGCQPGPVRPRIRYCAAPAGRVAYSTAGSGPVLLCDSGWITDLRAQLELFSFGPFIEQLAERFTVVRYDKPGCGLSDRDGADLSFEGQVAALAVADATGARRFGLFGASQGGQLAAALTARYPDRVEALVLYGTCASGQAPPPVRSDAPPATRRRVPAQQRPGNHLRRHARGLPKAADIVSLAEGVLDQMSPY
jgi:pimeloyl-ACP methyl ester carboxylesterase